MKKENIKTITFVGLDVVRKLGIERMFNIVCNYLDVEGDDVKGRTRKQDVAEARHVFCYLAYHSIANHTLKEVGDYIERDHATVLHSKNRIMNFLDFDKRTIKIISDLRNTLGKFTEEDVKGNKITPVHVGYYNNYAKKKKLEAWCGQNDVVSKIQIR